jgi:hypothetical protein
MRILKVCRTYFAFILGRSESDRLLVNSYAVIIILLVTGCASQNKYIKPDASKAGSYPSASERSATGADIVDRAQAAIWQQLITGAGKAGFVVSSPDPGIWTLQIRYTGDPKNYIDCGRVISKVKTAKGERNYDFPAAKTYQQYQLQQGGKVFLVDRRMNLDIQATLRLEAMTESRTRVKMEPQ